MVSSRDARHAQAAVKAISQQEDWLRSIGVAMVGVIAVTLAITPIHWLLQIALPHTTINISLLYMPAIIWLAATDGFKASILASVVAIVIYEFFFFEPIYGFSIDDPSAWISLCTLLLISMVIGRFTVELRRREHLAQVSQRRTAILYALSQEIAANTDRETLLAHLARQFCTNFQSEGLMICTIWLPGGQQQVTAHATGISDNILIQPLFDEEYQTYAELAFAHGSIGSLFHDDQSIYFIPIQSSTCTEGVLIISGKPQIMHLLRHLVRSSSHHSSLRHQQAESLTADQFATFCDQLTLALERARLQAEAIHGAALQESEHLKDALLDSVTHDLRSPITAIQTAAISLQNGIASLEMAEQVMLTDKIIGSVHRLAGIVDNLLLLTRLEGGATGEPQVSYPINDVVTTALDEMETAGHLHDHLIVVAIEDDPLEAVMDPSAIERVLINLVENAVKYSPPGSTITITASTWEAKHIIVRVRDEGIGIPPEERQAIFNKFHRLQQVLPWSPQTLPKGTGLGLAACAGIVQEHKGTIWAEPAPEAGSIVCFTLPTTD